MLAYCNVADESDGERVLVVAKFCLLLLNI